MEHLWIILGAVATILLAIFAFLQWKNGRTILRVEIRSYPFEMPKNLIEALVNFKTRARFPGYVSNDSSESLKTDSEEILNALSSLIEKYKLKEFYAPEVVDYVRMENTGNDEIKNIKITKKGMAFFLPEDNDWSGKTDCILIPTIQPGEKIEIKIWSTKLAFEEINILMGKGRPTIIKHEMMPSNIAKIVKYISNSKYSLMFNIILLVYLISLMASIYYKNNIDEPLTDPPCSQVQVDGK